MELVTRRLSRDELWAETAHIVQTLQAAGVTECEVQLGWPWALSYYDDDTWPAETIPVAGLLDFVHSLERRQLGLLGEDDLFVTVPGVELRLCHEADIHLEFVADDSIGEVLAMRCAENGLLPPR